MTERVVADLRVAAPLDAVWRALREPRELARWFGWDHDGLDAEIEMIFLDGAQADEAAGWSTPATAACTSSRRATASPGCAYRARRPRRSPTRSTTAGCNSPSSWRFALERHPGDDRTAQRTARPVPLPPGEPWFRARDDLFGLVVEDGAGLLVVDGGQATLSRYGPAVQR